MREFKASTKRGVNLVTRARYNEGFSLNDVYGSHSSDKERSWNWCFEQYMKTEEHENFHICSHNTFQYSVAWEGVQDGERILRLETANNSYLVWLER